MGTWGFGPFENDAAADFLDGSQGSPSRSVARALGAVAKTPAGQLIDAEVGGACWAACEMIALGFGCGDTTGLGDKVLDLVARVRPKEEHRQLALDVLARIGDRATSELAGLWHEGADGARFDAALADLGSRLRAAGGGPRQRPKPRTGDVIALQAAAPSTGLIVIQLVGAGEIAVFEGTSPDEQAAMEAVASRPAWRVPASVGKLLRRGRLLGRVPLRKALRGKKEYAGEVGLLEHYSLSSASGSGLRVVPYEEARDADILRLCEEDEIRAITLGTRAVERVRSPSAREAALRAERGEQWSARRKATTPGPFGDLALIDDLLRWIEQYGIDNAVGRFHDEATGRQGYGRPNEREERRSYAFAGLVALWCGGWPPDMWPTALGHRLPASPHGLMGRALSAARTLAGRVLTPDSELRLIWEEGPDQGAELRSIVASLRAALG